LLNIVSLYSHVAHFLPIRPFTGAEAPVPQCLEQPVFLAHVFFCAPALILVPFDCLHCCLTQSTRRSVGTKFFLTVMLFSAFFLPRRPLLDRDKFLLLKALLFRRSVRLHFTRVKDFPPLVTESSMTSCCSRRLWTPPMVKLVRPPCEPPRQPVLLCSCFLHGLGVAPFSDIVTPTHPFASDRRGDSRSIFSHKELFVQRQPRGAPSTSFSPQILVPLTLDYPPISRAPFLRKVDLPWRIPSSASLLVQTHERRVAAPSTESSLVGTNGSLATPHCRHIYASPTTARQTPPLGYRRPFLAVDPSPFPLFSAVPKTLLVVG